MGAIWWSKGFWPGAARMIQNIPLWDVVIVWTDHNINSITRFLKNANHSSSSRRGVQSIITKLNASISVPTPKTSQLQSPTPRSHQFLRDWRRPRKNPAWPYGSSHRKQPAPERKVNSGGSFTNFTLDMGRGHVLTMNSVSETKQKPSQIWSCFPKFVALLMICTLNWIMDPKATWYDHVFLLASNGLTMPLWLHDVNKKGHRSNMTPALRMQLWSAFHSSLFPIVYASPRRTMRKRKMTRP